MRKSQLWCSVDAMSMLRARDTRARAELLLNDALHTLFLTDVGIGQLYECSPVRTFRWHKGQQHFPGWYWSATERGHVMYESRLELLRLIIADFDSDVVAIRSQPFRMEYTDSAGKRRRHVPDFALVLADQRTRIVNVKPADRLADAKVRESLDSAHAVLQASGFETEIWTGCDPQVATALRFIAGYRNSALFSYQDMSSAQECLQGAMTIAEVEARLRARNIQHPRPLVMHFIWTRKLLIDLSAPITAASQLEAA